MAKQITIDEPVLIEAENGGIAYLTAKMNNHTIGIPILSQESNAMKLLQPTVNLRLRGSTLYTPSEETTPFTYGGNSLGVAIHVGKKVYGLPIFNVPENALDTITMHFNEATMVTEMQPALGENNRALILVMSINDVNYGIPLFTFNKIVDLQHNKSYPYPPEPLELTDSEEDGGDTENESVSSGSTGLGASPTQRPVDGMSPPPPPPHPPFHYPPDGVHIGPFEEELWCRPGHHHHHHHRPEDLIKTMISVGKPTVDFDSAYGSTFLNNKVTAYSDLINRIKRQFGWPAVELDLCDDNIAEFIDQAMELYTKYAGYTEEFLIFDSKLYKPGVGLRLDKLFTMTAEMNEKQYEGDKQDFDYDIQNYRKVLNVFNVEPGASRGVNVLFSLENTLAAQTYWSIFWSTHSFDLLTWNCVKNFLDTREKVLAQKIYFRFDPQTQYLRLTPEPRPNQKYMGLVACYVERPIRELINEPWIYEYSLALTLVAVGMLRSKYSFQMLSGATITGDALLTHGREKKKELEEMLFKGQGWIASEYAQPCFFIG